MYKKKIIIFIGIFMLSFALFGCAKNQISNEYIKVKSYAEIDLGGYSESSPVTEEDVEAYIEGIQYQNSELVEVKNQTIQNGDTVNIHCVGRLLNDIMQETIEENYTVTLGMGTSFEGLDESLLGRKVGDVYEFTSEFPKDYYDVGYAGKDVIFEVSVESVLRPRLPELNNEFVKNVSEISRTVEEYRKEVRQLLEESEEATWNLENVIWEKVLEETKVKKYPDNKVRKYSERLKASYEKIAEEYGMGYEEFVEKEMDSTPAEFEKQIENNAKEKVKAELLAEAIAEKEKLILDEEEYEEIYIQLAEDNGYEDIEAMKREMEQEELQQLALREKVKKWLVEHCEKSSKEQ